MFSFKIARGMFGRFKRVQSFWSFWISVLHSTKVNVEFKYFQEQPGVGGQ